MHILIYVIKPYYQALLRIVTKEKLRGTIKMTRIHAIKRKDIPIFIFP